MTEPMPQNAARSAVMVAREALFQALKLQVEPILEAIDENDESLVECIQRLNLLCGFDVNADLEGWL
jgi:hypothetical protein